MSKGISLHIGLNFVDPNHYSGWDGELNACEFDANDMHMIADNQGFKGKTLLTKKATRNNVVAEIQSAASKLKSGDIFLISFSGHGGQVPDQNNDETDGVDETWCLYDGQLIDDEIKVFWTWFAKGVRIFVVSDSCHSGTVIKAAYNSNNTERYLPKKDGITRNLTVFVVILGNTK